MRDLPQWVCWRYEERGNKPTKVPYTPAAPSRANTRDPRTWGTFEKARQTAWSRGYDGIGFVFTADDPFCGIDLDGCVDAESGDVATWARQIVESLSSYTEYSPSGRGVHVIVRAELPGGGNRVGGIEVYDRGRFFTVTGHQLTGTPDEPQERQEELQVLHSSLFERPLRDGSVSDTLVPAHNLPDTEVLRRATSAANGERFARLWAGDSTGYTSTSEADLALCSMLAFWCGPDEARIAALFARSGLAREKWEREDYRRRTIFRALEGTTSFYTPEQNGSGLRNPTRTPGSKTLSNYASDTPKPLPPAPPFPVEVMPSACRLLIREAEAALCCAPELVALPMLAVLSAAIGTSRVVEVKGGWREWAALFVAVVASPGAMKTPAAKVAKKPAFARQRELGRVYDEDREDWRREMREWEVEKRTAQKAGEPAPEEPQTPTMLRCVASDTTVEALVGILEDNPRGLLVYKDELAGWVRSMDQYKGGKGSDRQSWLSFWSCDEVVVDRKSRMGEPLIVTRPFVSLFGGIQPAMLAELGGGSEDGLMDRFLFAYPQPRPVRFTEDEVSDKAKEAYAALYRKLADERLLTDRHGDPNPRPLALSPEARGLFARSVDELGAETMAPDFPRRLEGVWSKLRGYLARLSLILAVCRCAEDPAWGERVEKEDVEAAVTLLAYFKAHARRVYAETAAPDPLGVLSSDLADQVRAAGGRLEETATTLYGMLMESGCVALPARPKELGQAIRALSQRQSALKVGFGWRGKEKVIRLELEDHSVGSVGGAAAVTNPANATNAGSVCKPIEKVEEADLDRQTHQDSPRCAPRDECFDGEEANNVLERSEHLETGRTRFTL